MPALVSLSYSQFRSHKFHCHLQADGPHPRRLLIFSEDSIFLDSAQVGNRGGMRSLYRVPEETGKIRFGSFVSAQKPTHFFTVNEARGRYFLHTYSILDLPFGEKRHCCPGAVTCALDCEHNLVLERGEERELLLSSQRRGVGLKTIKDIAGTVSGTELMFLGDGSEILTATVDKKSIMAVGKEKLPREVVGIEYWSGYYFFLCGENTIAIYKRSASTGALEEVKTRKISSEIAITISHLRIPRLEYSGRLVDILHKDLPAHILFLGMEKGAPFRTCLIKYDLYKDECSAIASVEGATRPTCVGYGPYDNGPVMVGFDDGSVLVFDYYSFDLMFKLNARIKEPVRWISYEPCSTVLIGTDEALYKCCLTDHYYAKDGDSERDVRVAVKRL